MRQHESGKYIFYNSCALGSRMVLTSRKVSLSVILLFCKNPERFLITSEVKCAHFHGIIAEKPIPSYQVYKGTVFELVDQAIDFIMSKIDRWIGTRSDGDQAPTAYEIPSEVIGEAIVNAVAHRDYPQQTSQQ